MKIPPKSPPPNRNDAMPSEVTVQKLTKRLKQLGDLDQIAKGGASAPMRRRVNLKDFLEDDKNKE